jgi:hypothetical protein
VSSPENFVAVRGEMMVMTKHQARQGKTMADIDDTVLDNAGGAANGAGQQHDSEPDVQAAGQPPGSTGDERPPASEPDSDDPDDAEHDDDGDSAARKARREAAGLRKRLRETEGRLTEAETERDTLRDTLTRQQQAVIDRDCDAARLSQHHIAAAKIDLENMLDGETGLLDTKRLEQTISAATTEFHIARPPAPNMQQATAIRLPGESASQQFAAAFAPKQR